MQQEKYDTLDELAAPNRYVAIPSERDLDYVIHFRQTCMRYHIDFARADEDERSFVIHMAEKSFHPKSAATA